MIKIEAVKVLEVLKNFGMLLGLILSIFSLFKYILPYLKWRKLRRFYELVQDWFDEIDRNLESGINLSVLDNKEKKISFYIKDHRLEYYKFRVSKSFIKKYLKGLGFKKEFRSNVDEFYRYSRCSSRDFFLIDYWQMLCGAFIKFHSAYKSGTGDYGYPNVEMRVKFLRQYLKIREK